MACKVAPSSLQATKGVFRSAGSIHLFILVFQAFDTSNFQNCENASLDSFLYPLAKGAFVFIPYSFCITIFPPLLIVNFFHFLSPIQWRIKQVADEHLLFGPLPRRPHLKKNYVFIQTIFFSVLLGLARF